MLNSKPKTLKQNKRRTLGNIIYLQDPLPILSAAAMAVIARRFTVTNFFIATSALAFQVFVLYPWHQKLDDDFELLKRENLKLVRELNMARAAEMSEIRDAFKRLKK